MRLVEEEHEFRLVRIADLGKHVKQLGEHPEQEGGVEPRALHQLVRGQNVDDAAPIPVDAHKILQIERRFAEEFRAALVFQHEKRTLDCPNGGLGDVSVLRRQFVGVLGDELEHRTQILQVEQQQPLLVRHAKHNVQNAFLDVVQV